MNFLSTLLLLGVIFYVVDGQSYPTNLILNQYPYPNGGYTQTFTYTSNWIPRLTTSSFVLYLASGTTTTFNLARGIYLGDQSLYPVGGFSHNYSFSGLPSWANYDTNTATLTVNTPSSFTTTNFTIMYSDSRSNTNSIAASFVPQSYVGTQNAGYKTPLNYRVASGQSQATASNIYTLVFPLFTTTNSSITSARTNNYGSVTNIGVRPWYNIIRVDQTSESDWNNVTSSLGFLIVNVSGTYVNGIIVSSSGYFTNSSGTYNNGIYQGNSGYVTNSSGTFLNGNWVGSPGYVIVGNQVYYAGSLVTPGSNVTNPTTGYIVTNATGTFVNGILVSNTGYFTNSSGTYYNGNFQGSSGFTTNATGTFYNGNYVGAPGYVIINGQAYYAGTLVTYSPNSGYLVTNATGTYVNGLLISNSGYFTNITGTYLNGVYQGNTGFTTNSSGTYFNGILVGNPGYVIIGNQVYYGGTLISSNGVLASSTFTSPSVSTTTTTTTTQNQMYIYSANGTIIGFNPSYTGNTNTGVITNTGTLYTPNATITSG